MSQLRFEFGQNWRRFIQLLDDDRIVAAERSLCEMLGTDELGGQRFLDVGCGSGLFSLAARRLGASVHSFDFDENSVLCARELKQRFHPDDDGWSIERGSILDQEYLNKLGMFDVVYAWGVLHHTGAMWDALDASCRLVRNNGRLFVAIYNDQGATSRRWAAIKRAYNRSPRPLRAGIIVGVGAYFGARAAIDGLIDPRASVHKFTAAPRGMSRWHDLIDWVGGYPFEVSKPEQIFDFVRQRGFILERLKTWGGQVGCNEYVFQRL
jgi:2-polyprenyl-6-hydroxyphenyl methylase/3-demethylubiquinone-9 3-methyltransferase